VGKLVAALENNDQQGCAKALDGLKKGQDYFVTQLASVGRGKTVSKWPTPC
jgi:flagellar hook-associated protein 3 FlgL